MLDEKFLQNTGAVRDFCQDICCELDEILNNNSLDSASKKQLSSNYEEAKKLYEELTSTGFFNKSFNNKDKGNILKIINKIDDIQQQASNVVKPLWAKQITNVNNFNQEDFCLCVKRLPYDLKNLSQNINNAFADKSSFFSGNLISNKNIFLADTTLNSTQNVPSMPFGIVYEVGEKSFVMASEKTSSCSTKQKDYEVLNMQTATFGDLKACIKGNAVKIKTPQSIVSKTLKNPLLANNNVVVLDAKYSKPVAIFCYGYNIKKVNLLKRKLTFIAKQLNVPMININVLKFYKNNKDYFINNTLSRKIFNELVDIIASDLQLYTKYDFKQGAKKLIGLNTNLRYNFIYKFAMKINSLLQDKTLDEADTADYIAQMFIKAVEKHNILTKKREKANGAPLFFPDDSTFIALPKDFLNED